MSQALKSHLWSAAVTFASTFLTVLGAAVVAIDQNTFSKGTLVALLTSSLITAGRSAGKLLLEDFLKTDKLLGVRNQ